MKAVTVTAVCFFEGIKDSLTFDVELNNEGLINTKKRLAINGFADGHATWNKDHYSICLYVHDETQGLAGIAWSDKDTMTANILGRRLTVGESFNVTGAHGEFYYKITTVTVRE